MNKKLPVFIVGCPRSGTTLMRLLLNNHPRIAIPDETGIFEILMNRTRLKKALPYRIAPGSRLEKVLGTEIAERFNRLPAFKRIGVRNIVDTLFTIYATSKGKTYWGAKTPHHYRYIPEIRKLFPSATIIFMIRDPRAVVASSKRYAKNNKSFWASHNIQTAIDLWKESIHAAKACKDDLVIVKYEELSSDPSSVIKEICNHLGVRFDPEMLNFYKSSESQISKMPTWHKETTKPVNAENIEKWKTELSEEEISTIDKRLADEMSYANYSNEHAEV